MKYHVVLLVEDSASQRKLIKGHLELMGFQVLEAANKSQALAIVAAQNFDWAVLDVALSSNDDFEGIEVAEAMKNAPVPIMYLTNTGDRHFKAAQKRTVYSLWEQKMDKDSVISFAVFNRKIIQFLGDCANGRRLIQPVPNKFLAYNGGFVASDKVVYLESENGELNIYLDSQDDTKIRVKLSLKKFISTPDNMADYFIQISSKHLINVNYILQFNRARRIDRINYEAEVVLHYQGKQPTLGVTRNHSKALKALLIP
ncbi:MAG: response regulator [Cyclobacteriaceae bacterium]